ncbi:MAG TPA: SAF domain-containing protein [Mycobacteriales bacterium]|nr:SAF domain-containing protein [Mycobacteriales bacterium]
MVLVGLLVMLLCAALAGTLLIRADRRRSVLALAQAVPAGHQVSGGDLRTVRVGSSGIETVSAQERQHVVGLTAAVDLVAGSLLTPEMLTDQAVPAPGEAVVGLALKPGQLPASGVDPSDRVEIIHTPQVNGDAESADVLVPSARVLDVHVDGDTGITHVSVVVPEGSAAAVARSASAGEATIAVLSRASS